MNLLGPACTGFFMTDELIGKQIGGYEVLSVIGYGGMATVYRAQQVSMKRIVALKVLPRQFVHDDTYLQRFNREVEIVARLEHRNIVPVHDYGEHEGQPYIVMRYMSGGSVDDLLARGPLDSDLIVSIIEQIAPALDYAHSKQVLHRDLKPSNVLLDDNGAAYLTDFGIARILGEGAGATITTQGVVGTPSYMSPEQAQGQPLDRRSDVYSLGVMLFEMATGRRPFESDTPYSIAVMQVTTAPPAPRSINPRVTMGVEQVILRALKKRPDDRYSTAVALSEALRASLAPPASSLHDTQPGVPRPVRVSPPPGPSNPPAPQQQLQRQPAVPPRAPAPSPVPAARPVPPPSPRRRSRPAGRGRGLWMNAAIGGLIGCGLLTLLVIIITVVVGSLQAGASDTGRGPRSDNTPDQPAVIVSAIPDDLDATSEAARRRLLGDPPTAPPTRTLASPSAETATPGIAPVGQRSPTPENP